MAQILSTKLHLAAGAVAVAAVPWLAYQWLKPKPLSNFPHNPVTSVLGDIPELMRLIKDEGLSVLDYFALLVTRHGPVVQICIGKKVILLIADRAEMERLYLKGKSVDMSFELMAVFGPLMPTGQISLSTNDVWKHHRRIMGPAMHRRYLSRMAPHVSTAANQLVKLWNAKIDMARGNSFDAASDVKLTSMDTINSIITGESFGCLERALASLTENTCAELGVTEFSGSELPPICQAVNTMMSAANLAAQLPFPSVTVPTYLFFNWRWRKDHQLLHTYLWSAVEEAKKREDILAKSDELVTDADCVVDMVVQQEVREGSEAFSKAEMLDELMIFIIAGQETTAAALMWFVKYMALDADIQRRLHEEVCEVFGSSLIDTSSIALEILDDPAKIPILEAVTVETLRCATVGGASRRRLLNDEVILGRHVPKGTDLLALTGLHGLSEAEWGPDAKQWRPSRWLRADGSFNRDAGPTGSPFGLGQRACFGQRLAVMQLKIFFATLSRAFIFKAVAPAVDSWTPITLISNQPKVSYVKLERWDL